ncbi:MAG TPA: NADPH-dependent F420 reductase [Anaeromyxobacter sp.]
MKIAIIGSGNIGGTAARLFAAAGHDVGLSHKSGPESLRERAAQLGRNACAMTVDEAAAFGDVVLLALPWRAREDLPAELLAGKIVVDATNPYRPDFTVYDLGDSSSSEEMLRTLPGARLVKAFNTLFAKDLASSGRPELPLDERTALLLAGDDPQAKELVSRLVEEIGFAPVDTGGLRDGGRLQQPGSPLYGRHLTGAEARAALRAAQTGAARSGEPTQAP